MTQYLGPGFTDNQRSIKAHRSRCETAHSFQKLHSKVSLNFTITINIVLLVLLLACLVNILVWLKCTDQSLHAMSRAQVYKEKHKLNSNKSQTQHAGAYKVMSCMSTDCELSTKPCSRFLYSLGPGFQRSAHIYIVEPGIVCVRL